MLAARAAHVIWKAIARSKEPAETAIPKAGLRFVCRTNIQSSTRLSQLTSSLHRREGSFLRCSAAKKGFSAGSRPATP